MAVRKKTGGRARGTQIKVTLETKEVISMVVNKELQTIETTLKNLSSLDRINTVIKLLPFVLPKQAELKTEVEIKEKPVDLSKLTVEQLKILQQIYDQPEND